MVALDLTVTEEIEVSTDSGARLRKALLIRPARRREDGRALLHPHSC
jgi:hypothetical protein